MNESIRRIYELQVKLAQESLNALKALQQHAASAEKGLDRLGEVAKSFGKGLLGGLSIGFVFTQIKDAIFGAIDAIDQLDKSATRLKMPIEEFTALNYAARQSDTEIGELEQGMKFLQKSFADFNDPAAETTKILKALGVDPVGKSMTENLLALADGLAKVTDANMKTRVELALMSRGGTALSGFLQKGREEITRLTEESKKLNDVNSQSLLLQGAYETEFKKMQEAAAGLTRVFTEGLLPSLTGILKAFNDSPKAMETFRTMGELVSALLKDMAIRAMNISLGINFFGKALVKVHEASVLLMTKGELSNAAKKIAEIGDAYKEATEEAEKFAKNLNKFTMPPPPPAPPSEEDKKKAAALQAQLELALKGAAAAEKHNKELEKQAAHYDRRMAQLDELLIKLKDENAETTEHAKILREIQRGEIAFDAKTRTKERMLARAAEIDQVREAAETWKKYAAQIEAFHEADTSKPKPESTIMWLERLTAGSKAIEIRDLREEIIKLNEALLAAPPNNQVYLAGLTEKIQKAEDRIKELAKTSKDEVQGLDKLMLEVADRADGYGKDLAGLFVDFASGANDAETSFTDFAVSFLRQLAQMTLQTLLFEEVIKTVRNSLREWAVQRSATSAATGIGSSIDMGSAKGNAFLGGNVLPFARGGVVTRPTLFAMAGGAGLMGEAGPEAVLPLHRGADGSLGVRGGSTVNVSVVNNASGARARTEEETQPDGTVNVRIMIEDVVDRALTRGRFDTSMAQVYGNTRRGRM